MAAGAGSMAGVKRRNSSRDPLYYYAKPVDFGSTIYVATKRGYLPTKVRLKAFSSIEEAVDHCRENAEWLAEDRGADIDIIFLPTETSMTLEDYSHNEDAVIKAEDELFETISATTRAHHIKGDLKVSFHPDGRFKTIEFIGRKRAKIEGYELAKFFPKEAFDFANPVLPKLKPSLAVRHIKSVNLIKETIIAEFIDAEVLPLIERCKNAITESHYRTLLANPTDQDSLLRMLDYYYTSQVCDINNVFIGDSKENSALEAFRKSVYDSLADSSIVADYCISVPSYLHDYVLKLSAKFHAIDSRKAITYNTDLRKIIVPTQQQLKALYKQLSYDRSAYAKNAFTKLPLATSSPTEAPLASLDSSGSAGGSSVSAASSAPFAAVAGAGAVASSASSPFPHTQLPYSGGSRSKIASSSGSTPS